MKEPELFIEKIVINEVRHLKDVKIPISNNERKHLILTGKNGSGKTSTLMEVREKIKVTIDGSYNQLQNNKKNLEKAILSSTSKLNRSKDVNISRNLANFKKQFSHNNQKLTMLDGLKLYLNQALPIQFLESYDKGEFILAFFNAKRDSKLRVPQGIQKVTFKDKYSFDDDASIDFLQYIVNLKADRSFARDENEVKVITEIDEWFNKFQKTLKYLFDDNKLELIFDRKEYNFNIKLVDGQVLDFNTLSDGYSAILNIVMELMLRMEGKVKNVYDIQGIVLIDEIETHLHIDLQKKILPFLTSFFPKIQFIVSTHSPFVINSLSNTVVYDLENHTRFEDLSDYPIDGIVEGYFDNDKYSDVAKHKMSEYEFLTEKATLSEKEEKRRFELFKELSDVSGKLAPELKMKFQQIQLKRLAKANG